ncbi:peptide chain release factor 1 [ANME-1 cluster archaeon AG-394-G21]|nr:peptide chain release factor 1 [ANME-1 cluster archaeon AG-394-G21]NAT10006.1 peptide chain release factor 1 [ANME-1 cluster archaeon AG-394-G06]
MDQIKKYEFRKILEELREKTGRGTELVSVYIPYDKQISDVTSQLRSEYGQAMNIKSKTTRTNVQSSLDSILAKLRYVRVDENGLVIFCGAVAKGGDRTDIETFIVEPPAEIHSYIYHCDSSFFLEPLEDLVDEHEKYGLIVLDKREATIGVLNGKVIESLKHITSAVPGKMRKGGQSAPRFQRLRLIAIGDFYKRIGEHTTQALLHMDLKGILIGGPSPTKEEFLKGSFLHYELQDKILGIFDVAYTDESGLYELVDKAEEVLEGLDLVRERKLMTKLMKLLVNKDSLVAYGEREVRRKLEHGAVDTLLVSEELDKELVHELVEMAEVIGSEVELISTEFEEGAQLKRAFGGVAAILRYG